MKTKLICFIVASIIYLMFGSLNAQRLQWNSAPWGTSRVTSYDWGDIGYDGDETRTFAIKNTSPTSGATTYGSLTVTWRITSGGTYWSVSSTSNLTISRGSTQSRTIRFRPGTSTSSRSGTFRAVCTTIARVYYGTGTSTSTAASNTWQTSTSTSSGGMVVSFSGKGQYAARAAWVSPTPFTNNVSSYNWGDVGYNQEETRRFSLRNYSYNATTTLQQLRLSFSISSGTTYYSITSGGGNQTISSGSTHNVDIRFRPGTSTSTRSGNFRVQAQSYQSSYGLPVYYGTSNTAFSDEFIRDTSTTYACNISFSGKGSYASRVAWTAGFGSNVSSYTWGQVGVSQEEIRRFTLRNYSNNANSTLQRLYLNFSISSGTTYYYITSGGGNQTISGLSGSTHNLDIRFRPGSTTGTKSGNLRIQGQSSQEYYPIYYGTSSTTYSSQFISSSSSTGYRNISLSGTGIRRDLTIAPSSVQFGNVAIGEEVYETITISNPTSTTFGEIVTGTIGQYVWTPYYYGSPYFEIVEGAGNFSLSRGQSREIVVRYTPGDELGNKTGALRIYSHNATNHNDPKYIYMYGTGFDPNVYVENFPFAERFESESFPSNGWTTHRIEGTGSPGTWNRNVSGTSPNCQPFGGGGMARFYSYGYYYGTRGTLVTPRLLFGEDVYRISFWMYRDTGYPNNADLVNVYISPSYELNEEAELLGTVNRSTILSPAVDTIGWYQYSYGIPEEFTSGRNTGYVILEGVSEYGNNIFLDNFAVTIGAPDPPVLRYSIWGNVFSISWEPVLGANSYLIYSSYDPNLPIELWDFVATVGGTDYLEEADVENIKFYRVIASTTVYEERTSIIDDGIKQEIKSESETR